MPRHSTTTISTERRSGEVVFADTHFFIGLLNPKDAAHEAAVRYISSFSGRLLTTEWVLVEVAGRASSPVHLRQPFLRFYDDLKASESVVVLDADHSYFERGMNLYRQRSDKEWSLVDCISFVVMQQYGITEALTGDRHFEQAGFVPLLK